MARPGTEREAGRIAIVGAASPAGSHLKAALADHGVSGSRVALYGHRSDVAVLSEYDGEARLVQPSSELEPTEFAAAFVCELGHDAASFQTAAASGTLVVDLTGAIPGSVLAGSAKAKGEARLVAVPHPLTTLLAGLLAPIHRALGLAGVSAFVVRPASDFGEPGLEELREQTVRLLRFEPTPTDVFGTQIAFNVLPAHLLPSRDEGEGARIVGECRALLAAPELPFALSHVLVPAFFGHAVAAHLALARGGREGAIAAWRGATGVTVAGDPDTGALLEAPEEPGCLIARVDELGPSALSVWAVVSEAGATAAGRALAVAVDAGVL